MMTDVIGPEPSLDVPRFTPGVLPTMMVDDASVVAVRRAERDRGTLARLIKAGKVTRDASVGANVPGAAPFRAQIEALVRPTVNLAIRPNKKRRR